MFSLYWKYPIENMDNWKIEKQGVVNVETEKSDGHFSAGLSGITCVMNCCEVVIHLCLLFTYSVSSLNFHKKLKAT